MEKLKMRTPDFTDENIARLAELFPNCVTESKDENGNLKRAIDFDQLRQELSGNIIEGPQERYHLDWPGKREALLTANAPIAKTLRPSREESVDFDTTKNLYIEGDNLDALKLLQETYLGKVKMIYIDPPYNTGNDFIYEDDFAEDKEAYFERSMQVDEDGNRLIANNESNGRFHSDWLTMLYSRLRLARNLLRDDGAIFISIDDNEQSNLKRLCDEVFGEENFIANLIWEKRFTRNNDAKMMSFITDYVMFYRKSSQLSYLREPRTEKTDSIYNNPDNDPRGRWTSVLYTGQRTKDERKNLAYPITNPHTGDEVIHPVYAWKYSKEQYEIHAAENRLYWGKAGENQFPRLKRFLSELKEGVVPVNLWNYKETGTSDDGTKELDELIGKGIFDYPKPPSLVRRMLHLAAKDEDVVLDFFSGSATAAHAVMQLNAIDGGKRKFILVQLPEETDEKSEAFKAGYKTIAEIGKERIRRAGKKIKEEAGLMGANLDIGFRVLKVDTSNMKDVYYSPDRAEQRNLLDQVGNIKEDRTSEDLLFQVLLDWGVDLALPISKETVSDRTVFFVDNNALVACFDTGIDEDFVKQLANRKPLRVVFRDSGFASDAAKINVEQIFKLISPTTEVKSI